MFSVSEESSSEGRSLKVGGSTQRQDVSSKASKKICGDYQVTRVLGEGSFGEVSLVKGPDGLAHAAKKSIAILNLPSGATIPDFDFYVEVDMLMRFEHPNLMSAESYFYSASESCAILPVASGDLASWLEHFAPVASLEERLEMFKGCTRGLAYLHANGVIHRDIKPGNILVINGAAKISDFGGCATTLGRKLPYEETIMTSFWRPPELFYEKKGDYSYSYEVDVWSMLIVGLDVVFDLPDFGMRIYDASKKSAEDFFSLLKSYGCYVPPKGRKLASGNEDLSIYSRVIVNLEMQPFVDFMASSIAAAPLRRPNSARLYQAVLEALGETGAPNEYLSFGEAKVAYAGAFTEETRQEAMKAFDIIFEDGVLSPRVEFLSIDIFDRASTYLNSSKDTLRLNALCSVFLAATILGYQFEVEDLISNFDVPGFSDHLGKVLHAINFNIYRPDLMTSLGLTVNQAKKLSHSTLSPESVRVPISKRKPVRKVLQAKKAPKAKKRIIPVDERDFSPRRDDRYWWQPRTPADTPIMMF